MSRSAADSESERKTCAEGITHIHEHTVKHMQSIKKHPLLVQVFDMRSPSSAERNTHTLEQTVKHMQSIKTDLLLVQVFDR